MSLSREEYLTVKNKLEYYIFNRIQYTDLARKEKDKTKKEQMKYTVELLNKITMGIIGYVLNEEKTLEEHVQEIEDNFLKLIPLDLYIDPSTLIEETENR